LNYTVPPLSDCDPQVEPFEYQVLIRQAEVQEKTTGGIFLAADTKDAQQFRADHARLVAVSPLAFNYERDMPSGTRVPQVGDEVFVPKFSGAEVIGKDGKSYKLVPDRDIKAVIERAANTPLYDEVMAKPMSEIVGDPLKGFKYA
jgi:co-chaperonin GroES (HSP10)